MEIASLIEENDFGLVKGIYRSHNLTEVNIFRRACMNDIPTYAIDVVIFYHNSSARIDEILALRLGQLVIDHDVYEDPKHPKNNPKYGDGYRFSFDVEGPMDVTTEVLELPFKKETPIITLNKGQRIKADCIVRQDTANTHVKWRPISSFAIGAETKEGYEFSFRNIGMLDSRVIIAEALNHMEDAKKFKETSIFSKLVLA